MTPEEEIAQTPPASLERIRMIWRHDPGMVLILVTAMLSSIGALLIAIGAWL